MSLQGAGVEGRGRRLCRRGMRRQRACMLPPPDLPACFLLPPSPSASACPERHGGAAPGDGDPLRHVCQRRHGEGRPAGACCAAPAVQWHACWGHGVCAASGPAALRPRPCTAVEAPQRRPLCLAVPAAPPTNLLSHSQHGSTKYGPARPSFRPLPARRPPSRPPESPWASCGSASCCGTTPPPSWASSSQSSTSGST